MGSEYRITTSRLSPGGPFIKHVIPISVRLDLIELQYDEKSACRRHSTYNAERLAKGADSDACGESGVGRYYAARAQRMDLLGHLRQKSGDEGYPHQEGALEAEGWNAQALLLGRLHSSLKASPRG